MPKYLSGRVVFYGFNINLFGTIKDYIVNISMNKCSDCKRGLRLVLIQTSGQGYQGRFVFASRGQCDRLSIAHSFKFLP